MRGKVKKEWADAAADLLFPPRCPVCDKPVAYYDRKRRICRGCVSGLPVIRGSRCFCCGRQLKDQEKEFCADCRKNGTKRYFIRGLPLCTYDDVMRTSIYRLKYGGRREYAEFYGAMMAEAFGSAVKRAGIQGIIPVPLHPKREYERGYNQAALLARAFGKRVGIPVYEDYVVRTRHTPPMKMLSAGERQNNLKKAFKIGRNDVKLKITIVIDDIYTTGSTIDAVAKALKEAGMLKVYFLTLASGEDF